MGWHRDDSLRVYCGQCRRPIVMCRGIDNDWMHEADREERCADGQLARPETPEQVDTRHSGARLVDGPHVAREQIVRRHGHGMRP